MTRSKYKRDFLKQKSCWSFIYKRKHLICPRICTKNSHTTFLVSDLPEAFSHLVTEKWTWCPEENHETRIDFSFYKQNKKSVLGRVSFEATNMIFVVKIHSGSTRISNFSNRLVISRLKICNVISWFDLNVWQFYIEILTPTRRYTALEWGVLQE